MAVWCRRTRQSQETHSRSVPLFARSNCGMLFTICHLVIQGSFNWVIGCKVTRPCNIIHNNDNALGLPNSNSDKISMIDVRFHIYIEYKRFTKNGGDQSPSLSCLYAASSAVESEILDNWAKVLLIVDRVQKHTYGHESFSDMGTLLSRNGLWDAQGQHYLATAVAQCTNCNASSTHVSITSLDKSFIDVVLSTISF